MAATSTRPGLFEIFVDELRPHEGRLGASLRMTLCCVIVVVLSMSQHVPEAALSCYLIFFASRDNAASGILIALALIIAASVGILLGLLFLQIAADEPMLRLFFMAAFTFGGMYFSVATKAGPIAATVGFVFAFVMTLNDFVPVPELLSRGLSWMWVVVFFPMATLVLVNALIGPNPAKLARRYTARRLAAAAGVLRDESGAREEATELLAEGAGESGAHTRLGALFGFHSKAEATRLAAIAPEARSILADSFGARPDPALAQSFALLAKAIEERGALPALWRPFADIPANQPLAASAERLAGWWSGRLPLPANESEKAAPANTFTNPAYMQFALKTMLAVFITYAIYTVGGWFEIHTAMITCFYVALGTTGETLHKATLRIIGCLVGAAMGVGSIIFIMPHMTDIGHLLLLVAAGSFIAAWVANGSSLIQYMGWQMALAFFLCVLKGFGPAFDIDVATDRILGILIGNVVVTVVFLWLWPTSVSTSIARNLSEAAKRLGEALRPFGTSLAPIAPKLGEAERLGRLSNFEANRLRLVSPILPHAAAIEAATQQALPEVAHLRLLRQRQRYLYGAPRCVKAATLAQEAETAGFLNLAATAIMAPEPQARTMLNLSLHRSTEALHRLERLAHKTPPRAPWRRDVVETAGAYRKLVDGFARTLEAL